MILGSDSDLFGEDENFAIEGHARDKRHRQQDMQQMEQCDVDQYYKGQWSQGRRFCGLKYGGNARKIYLDTFRFFKKPLTH